MGGCRPWDPKNPFQDIPNPDRIPPGRMPIICIPSIKDKTELWMRVRNMYIYTQGYTRSDDANCTGCKIAKDMNALYLCIVCGHGCNLCTRPLFKWGDFFSAHKDNKRMLQRGQRAIVAIEPGEIVPSLADTGPYTTQSPTPPESPPASQPIPDAPLPDLRTLEEPETLAQVVSRRSSSDSPPTQPAEEPKTPERPAGSPARPPTPQAPRRPAALARTPTAPARIINAAQGLILLQEASKFNPQALRKMCACDGSRYSAADCMHSEMNIKPALFTTEEGIGVRIYAENAAGLEAQVRFLLYFFPIVYTITRLEYNRFIVVHSLGVDWIFLPADFPFNLPA
jgi:hypothetical protein